MPSTILPPRTTDVSALATQTSVNAIKAVTDLLPDAGALTSLLPQSVTSYVGGTSVMDTFAGFYYGATGALGTTSYVPVLSISGAGELFGVGLEQANGNNGTHTCKVTIDGAIVCEYGFAGGFSGENYWIVAPTSRLRFNTSLAIHVKSTTSSTSLGTYYAYTVE